MKQLFFVALFVLISSFLQAQQFSSISKDAKLSYKIIPSANHTSGYDIYNGAKLYVHQPTIPGMPGNTGFLKKESAEKVAKKVIGKIQKGEMPPSITIDEMKQIGVISK